MKYRFDYKPSALDLWKLSVYEIYASMVGLVNIIFTLSMILLAGRFWGDINSFLKIILIIGITLFVIFQPLAIYLKARKQIEGIPKDMEIAFSNKGMHIITSDQDAILKWNQIRLVSRPKMIIVFVDTKQGFIITDRMLGGKKGEFYKYLDSKIKK